mgnify:CR=1 FL=1
MITLFRTHKWCSGEVGDSISRIWSMTTLTTLDTPAPTWPKRTTSVSFCGHFAKAAKTFSGDGKISRPMTHVTSTNHWHERQDWFYWQSEKACVNAFRTDPSSCSVSVSVRTSWVRYFFMREPLTSGTVLIKSSTVTVFQSKPWG